MIDMSVLSNNKEYYGSKPPEQGGSARPPWFQGPEGGGGSARPPWVQGPESGGGSARPPDTTRPSEPMNLPGGYSPGGGGGNEAMVGPGGTQSGNAQGYEYGSGWKKPAWFNAPLINQGQWGTWGSPEAYANIGENQQWYRSPSWPGHVAYNPYWGYQDWANIVNTYENAEGPMSWDQFTALPWAQQLGQDPTQFFPNRGTGKEGGGGGANYGPYDWSGWGQGQIGNYGETTVQPQVPQGTGFQFPPEWDVASNMAGDMARTGMPSNWSPWYQQAKQQAQYDVKDAIDQAAEQAGLSGTRWSTPLGRSAQDIAGRRFTDLGTEFAGQQLGALEQARGRQLQAGGLLQGLGQGYLNAPMDWSQQMYGMGQGMQGTYQGAMDRQRQEAMRMFSESNPWLAQAMGFSGMQSQMMPQQYQPSGFSQILGGLGSILPFLFM